MTSWGNVCVCVRRDGWGSMILLHSDDVYTFGCRKRLVLISASNQIQCVFREAVVQHQQPGKATYYNNIKPWPQGSFLSFPKGYSNPPTASFFFQGLSCYILHVHNILKKKKSRLYFSLKKKYHPH